MHSPFKSERLWFSHVLESQSRPSPVDTSPFHINADKKRRIHELLARSEVLDNFLQVKFPNLKRVWGSLAGYLSLEIDRLLKYGLEGGESMIPALDSLFSAASQGMICA